LLLGAEPTSLPGFVHRRRERELARERLAAVGLRIDPATPIAQLGVAQRQLVAIAKAIAAPVRLLILDEPTSSLAAPDIEHLLGLVQRQRTAGTAVLFISHKLDEVFRVADRIAVLRDGRNAGTRDTAATTPAEIIALMVGRELQHRDHRELPVADEVLLDINGLQASGLTAPFDLALHAGEIVGLYGLKGAGRTDLLRALFGLTRRIGGEIRIGGHPVHIRSPRDAMRAGLGWVCRDRKELGLFGNLDVGENLSIAALDKSADAKLSRLGFIDRSAERRAVTDFIGRLGIRTAGARQAITALSGGNQQKVLLARWLMCRPRVLILDEPTAGIDVGAKSEIYALMHELSSQGIGILLVSSELPEVLALSDRVLVMHDGALAGELDRAEASEERVMQAIHGHAPANPP
jgi:ABC-type sugar transport system ATPase subunit